MLHTTSDRVVITGIGLHCAAGPTVDAAWKSLLAGESHVDRFESELDESWPGRYFAAGRPVSSFHPELLAGTEALKQSGLSPQNHVDDNSLGFVFGASKGRLAALSSEAVERQGDRHRWLLADFQQDRRRVGDAIDGSYLVADSPLYPWPPSSAGNDLRNHLKLTGPAECPVAACASGLIAFIQAARWIQWGTCRAAIAGSADYSLTPSVLAAYRRLGVLSKWTGEPSAACRPFARDRSGFVIGEGVGALVLESETDAISRGATPLAVWSGHDHRTDPTGIIESDASGETIRVVAENAIRDASLTTADIDAVCCHGTGTIANDRSEAVALRNVFGQQLDDIPCFSLKGALGHTLGASGSVETAICVRAIRDQILPPHVNGQHVDPECPIGPLPSEAVSTPLRHLLKLSYGFGGHVAAAVISRC